MTTIAAPDVAMPDRVRLRGREFESFGGRAIRFIERFCVCTKGRWRGQPFVVLPWQQRLLWELFEVEWDAGREQWRRRFRWAYIEIPKKNGKTELVAAITLYMLLIDEEESPEIAVGSNSDDQANLVFGAARDMVELSPTLAGLVRCYTRELVIKENPAAKIHRVSAKAKTKDGLNLSCVALDELHEFDASGEQLFNVLTNGTAARQQPLVFMITTAGYDPESLCGRFHDHAVRVIAGETTDPAFFARIFTCANPDVDISDDAALEVALREANPSYGITTSLPFYLDARRKGPANFLRYFLDIWTPAEGQWLPAGAWAACADLGSALSPGLPVWAGVDAATKDDSAAVVAVQWSGGETPHLVVRSRIWERPLDPATGRPLDDWRVPGGEIAEHLRALHTAHPGSRFAYDPAYVTWLAADLTAEGLTMIEYPQTNGRMCPPTAALYTLVTDRRLAHDGDPALARHIAGAIEVTTMEGKTRLSKARGRRRVMIDGAIALVMAVGLALAAEPEPAPLAIPGIHILGGDDDGD